ncbi:hypothetical protein ACNFBT_12290 [Pseudomonas sp. NY15181]|uniref:hypothetical protein n=1 Tax=Pseudomonas sp. NY15181 TaxID=3400349 RepID=UPI003A8A26DD
MSFVPVLASLVSSAIATITPVLSAAGSAAASFCTTVLPRVAPMLLGALEKLNTFVGVAQAVLQLLQVFKPSEQLDEMGDRTIQAAEKGIKPDDFDNFEEYMDKIRAFELDPKRSAEISSEQKYAAGLMVGGLALDDKFKVSVGTMANIWVLPASAPEYFNAKRLEAILGQTRDVLNVINYFNGKLGPADALAVEESLMSAEKALDPAKDNAAIYADLDEVSRQVQKSQ